MAGRRHGHCDVADIDDIVNFRWNPTLKEGKPDVPTSGVWKGKDGMKDWIKVGSTKIFYVFD